MSDPVHHPNCSGSVPSSPIHKAPSFKKKLDKSGDKTKNPSGRSLHYGGGEPDKKRRKLYGFPAREVSEEMTLLDAGLLRLIKASELDNGAWMKKDKDQRAPNIMAMVRSFNNVALLVPTEILEEETPQARAKVVTAYIKIAQECYSHGNYNSLKAVLAGLQSIPIFRLSRTWKEVATRRRRKFEELTTLMHEDNNWSVYRLEISKKLQDNTHFIPFLGIFLTTTAFSQTAAVSFDPQLNSSDSDMLSVDSVTVANKRRMSTHTINETYHLLEAITVREKLEKLRRNSVTLSTELSPADCCSLNGDSSNEYTKHDRSSSPLALLNGHTPNLSGGPPIVKNEVVTCGSCDEEKISVSIHICTPTSDSVSILDITCSEHKTTANALASCSNFKSPSEVISDSKPSHEKRKKVHLTSEGNVRSTERRNGSSNFSNTCTPESSSAKNVPRKETGECDVNPSPESHNMSEGHFIEGIDHFPDLNSDGTIRERAVTMPKRETTPPRIIGKKMRVTKGLSRTAKFFAMLKSRYRNGMSTSVCNGIGEYKADQGFENFSREQVILLNGTMCDSESKKAKIVHHEEETCSHTPTTPTTTTIDERSTITLSRSSSDKVRHSSSKRHNRKLSTNMSPSEVQEGQLTRILSGSLEGLLSAMDTQLPSKRGSNASFEQGSVSEGGRGGCGKLKVIRSPSLLALKSFDVDDGNNDIDGNRVSISSSFSSPSLDSYLDPEVGVPSDFTTEYSPSDLTTSVLGSCEAGGMCGSRGVRGEGVAGKMQRGRRSSDKESLSRSPSNSSMESAESCQPQTHLPNVHTHRRNSSDPNFFLNNNPPKVRGNGKIMHITPPSNTSFQSKLSSPLIRAFTHSTSPKSHSSQLRRGGQPTNLVSRNLWRMKEEHLMGPQELLHQYQFLSLGCCYLIESNPQIREILTGSHHNSEAVNYKLSYTREPS